MPVGSIWETIEKSGPGGIRDGDLVTEARPLRTYAGELSQARMLLVEDNPMNLYVFQESLGVIGLPKAQTATTLGQVEVHMRDILAERFDLLVFDIMLPDGEAFGMLENLAGNIETPVFAYTARTGLTDRARMEKADVQAVIEKPVTLDRLRRAMALVFPDVA